MSFTETFFNLEILSSVWPLLLEGFWMTVKLAAFVVPLSVVVGLGLAVLQDLPSRWLRVGLAAYVDIMRAFPPLVLLIFIFYGLPFVGVPLGEFSASVLAL